MFYFCLGILTSGEQMVKVKIGTCGGAQEEEGDRRSSLGGSYLLLHYLCIIQSGNRSTHE